MCTKIKLCSTHLTNLIGCIEYFKKWSLTGIYKTVKNVLYFIQRFLIPTVKPDLVTMLRDLNNAILIK